MNPTVELNDIPGNNNSLTFTLSGVNVSIANAIRRVILSDINTVVFRTTPHEKNKANILLNTSRLNNEDEDYMNNEEFQPESNLRQL